MFFDDLICSTLSTYCWLLRSANAIYPATKKISHKISFYNDWFNTRKRSFERKVFKNIKGNEILKNSIIMFLGLVSCRRLGQIVRRLPPVANEYWMARRGHQIHFQNFFLFTFKPFSFTFCNFLKIQFFLYRVFYLLIDLTWTDFFIRLR